MTVTGMERAPPVDHQYSLRDPDNCQMRMTDPEPTDEPAGRPQGGSCLILGVMGIAAVFLAAIILALAGSVLFVGMPGPTDHPAVGRRLPQLELEPLTGTDEPVTLDDLAGKVVLVNLWATWCQPCRVETPHIAELGRKLRDQPDFKLLTISCGSEIPEDVDRLRTETKHFLDQLNTHIPAYADPDWTTRKAFDSLGSLEILPTTFVIDRQGVIRGVWPGYGPGVTDEMEQLILRLLQEQG